MSNNPRKPTTSSPRPPKPPPSSTPPTNVTPPRPPVSARASARRPAAPSNRSSMSGGIRTVEGEEDARVQSATLLEELKQQLARAEEASEHYQKHAEVLQSRLDEVNKEQTSMEEQAHDKDSKFLALQDELMESRRQRRDLEKVHDVEREKLLVERQLQQSREEELQSIIQRLNETIKQKEMRMTVDGGRPASLSRSSSFRNQASPELDTGQTASTLERSPSRNNSKLLLQKDKVIEDLRLQLAETQIKIAEMEHLGDGRMQELEKTLLETRMANARLMEDNESFQLLLSEKTLKGDFGGESRAEAMSGGMGSLADELQQSPDLHEGESEAYRKLEAENKALRDSNKALTLYIDKIIGRLLQHEGFEHIIHDKDEKGDMPPPPPKRAATEKALPPAPGGSGPSFLQRASSVIKASTTRSQPQQPQPQQAQQPRQRPMSYMPTAHEYVPESTANENPETAPSIPLGRHSSVKGHRRSRSDQNQIQNQNQADPSAAAVVGQMYRGSPLRSTSGGPMSPASPSLSSARPPFFAAGNAGGGSGGRVPSATSTARDSTISTSGLKGDSSSNSIISDHSGELSTGASSPPMGPGGAPAANNFSGAVMKQNQLRPLRLVKENSEEETARKKANRGSWIGWFNRGQDGGGQI
ncbi:MAG: hypothetical protein Q9227_002056 [Pyrenula ochraceoflavens]